MAEIEAIWLEVETLRLRGAIMSWELSAELAAEANSG
jgi:hypothetical protein